MMYLTKISITIWQSMTNLSYISVLKMFSIVYYGKNPVGDSQHGLWASANLR